MKTSNLFGIEVEFLSPQVEGVTAYPPRSDRLSNREAGINGGHPEPDRESRPAELLTSNTSEVTSEPSLCRTSQRGVTGWVQKDTIPGLQDFAPRSQCTQEFLFLHAPLIRNPADSGTLPVAPNAKQEQGKPSTALARAGANRMRYKAGIVPEANARGKTTGYADRDTVILTIESASRVKKS